MEAAPVTISEGQPMNCVQIGALPEGGPRRLRPQRSSALPGIVVACFVLMVACPAWTSISVPASSSVSATATHPQEHDTAHGEAIPSAPRPAASAAS